MNSGAYKLADFFSETLADNIKDILIIANNGVYELFGRYRIKRYANSYNVVDVFTRRHMAFSSLKSSVAWCTFDSSGKYICSRRLHYLDLKLSSLDIDIQIHKDRIKNTNVPMKKQLHLVRLQKDIDTRRSVVIEIEKIINTSKELQSERFGKVQKKKNYQV